MYVFGQHRNVDLQERRGDITEGTGREEHGARECDDATPPRAFGRTGNGSVADASEQTSGSHARARARTRSERAGGDEISEQSEAGIATGNQWTVTTVGRR